MNTFQFVSTRGDTQKVDAPQAVFQGLAPDGGLFVPERLPNLGLDLAQIHKTSYRDLTRKILKPWLPGYTSEAIDSVVSNGYGSGTFDYPELTPIKSFGTRHFIELFHGPTLAFKDLALSLLPHLLVEGRHLMGISKNTIILAATSGDTGSAALTGFANVPETQIIVFYPSKGISPIQKKQMTCQTGGNISVCAVDGNFDDAQTLVKNLFSSAEMKAHLAECNGSFSTANSMNIGRLVPQMVYYFHAYGQLVQRGAIPAGTPVNIVVPSGNFGNILASWYAREAGLPVNKFIVASNKNRALTDFFSTGTYNANRDFHRTCSPSMDILVSSNLERLVYHLSGNDSKLISGLMADLKENRRYEVPQELKTTLQHDFSAGFADDAECCREIGAYYEKTGYVMDPHTAVASRVLSKYREETGDHTPALIAATASPFKFTSTVFQALFGDCGGKSDFELIHELSHQTGLKIPHQIDGIEKWRPLHSDLCHPTDAAKYVRTAIFRGEH